MWRLRKDGAALFCIFVVHLSVVEATSCANINLITCPCGEQGFNFSVPVEICQSVVSGETVCKPCSELDTPEYLCSLFKHCRECESNIRQCSSCPDGGKGPYCLPKSDEDPGIHSRADKQAEGPCATPQGFYGGLVQCRSNRTTKVCIGTCSEGYLFPDKTSEALHTCVYADGHWYPRHEFPQCEPECSFGCMNGGTCVSPNYCACKGEFRGNRCQYPISRCDLKRIGFKGGYNCTHFSEGSDCHVTCSGEYSRHRCSVHGVWNPPLPPCEEVRPISIPLNCDLKQSQFRGAYNCSFDREGTHCTVFCVQGSSTKHDCDRNGVWNPPLPDCKEVISRCEIPEQPKFGYLSCRTGDNKITCTGNCASGFRFPDGGTASQLECSYSDGVWRPRNKFAECAAECDVQCRNGGTCVRGNRCVCPRGFRGPYCQYTYSACAPKNSSFTGTYNCTHNSEVTNCDVSCVHGSTSRHRCTQDGVWNPPLPSCEEVVSRCPVPLAPNAGFLSCRTHNNKITCTGRCFDGYQYPDGSSEKNLECSYSHGAWIPLGEFPSCKPVCYTKCQNGGSCVGNNACVCPSDYRGTLCQYAVSLCDPKRQQFRGVHNCSHGSAATDCLVTCFSGESSYHRCSVTGTWRPPLPSCVSFSPTSQGSCTTPSPPNSGYISCRRNGDKMLCTGTCHPGYHYPDGSNEKQLECSLSNDEWSPSKNFPDCSAICTEACQNGGTCISNNRCSCPRGYRGRWCQYARSLCSLNDFKGGWSCTHTEDETNCRVYCSGVDSYHRCSVEGVWTPPLPACDNSSAAVPSCQTHNDCGPNEKCVRTSNGYNECVGVCRSLCGRNSVCLADDHVGKCECSPGYKGNAYSLDKGCTRSDTAPEARCENPGPLPNGRVVSSEDSSEGFSPGSSITFACQHPYSLRGHDVINCTVDGSWNFPKPECVRAEISKRCGTKPTASEWPWHVGIARYIQAYRSYEILCSGTLIGPKWVLTAARCIAKNIDDNIDKSKFQVHFGKKFKDNSRDDNLVQSRKVHDVYISHDESLDTAVALVELDAEVLPNNRIQAICLPDGQSSEENLKEGEAGVLTGWREEKLQESHLSFVAKSHCQPEQNSDGTFCAKYLDDVPVLCEYNSGAPFVFRNTKEQYWVVEGIVQWTATKDCDTQNKYLGLIEISRLSTWIEDTIGKRIPRE